MYSRKYIRPTSIAASGERIERPSPPPDYAGVAFRASDARTEQDYPETVIASADDMGETSAEMPSESVGSESDGMSEDLSVESAEPETAEPYWRDDPPYLEPENPSEPPSGIPSPSEEESDEPARLLERSPSDENGASSPLKWLRELKMEDFLLLWLLLMLLYGESNEEIDLLLSLLLFAGR